MIEAEKKWGTWVDNILLILGASFLLTGIIFFFAFNWQNMISLYKFTAIEIGILFCVLGAIIYSTQTSFLASYLTGASVLVGVFLAVFGQIYQTGADTFQLFAVWAALILPWVFLAQSTPLWFIWLVVVNAALIFFLENSPYFNAILLIFNMAVLLIKEQCHWLQERWLRIAITFFLLILAFQPIDQTISNGISLNSSQAEPFFYYSSAIAVLTLGILIYTYGFHLRDLWIIALTSTEIAILLCDLCMRILTHFEIREFNLYFYMLLLTIFIFSLTAYFLIWLGKKQTSKR